MLLKHVIIAAHPRLKSFTLAMAQGYAAAVEEAGDHSTTRDLYRLPFDPVLHEDELPDHPRFAPRSDVLRERDAIKDGDIFVLVYPLWFNAAPAILKGYVDRVFGMGFGYSPHHLDGNHPLLTGKKLVSFSCSGAPQHWVEASGAWQAMQAHFDQHFAAVTGLEIIGHHNMGGIVADLRPDVAEAHIEDVKRHAREIAAVYR